MDKYSLLENPWITTWRRNTCLSRELKGVERLLFIVETDGTVDGSNRILVDSTINQLMVIQMNHPRMKGMSGENRGDQGIREKNPKKMKVQI